MGGGAIQCPQCGAPLRAGSRLCTSCGAPVSVGPSADGQQESGPNKRLFWILTGAGLLILVLIVVLVSISRRGSSGLEGLGPDAISDEGRTVEPLRFKDYTNNNFSFATRLPRDWQGIVSGEELIFSGADATEQYLTTIKFSFVTNTLGNTLQGQIQEFEEQLSGRRGFRLLSSEPVQIGGSPAARLLAEYDGPEESAPLRQDQLIVDCGLYYYYISYTAPVELFDKYEFVMNELVDSFKFLR